MVFCRKCGTENAEINKFCGKCGFQFGDIEKRIGGKKGIAFVIVIIALIGFGYYHFAISGAVTGVPSAGFSNDQVLEGCPYECCDDGNYEQKSCSRNHECVSNSCIEIDSDNDGLSDIRERQLGTNPQLYDTDGDSLSDSKEVDMGTNPLSKNSDGDRYDDNADGEPLVKNTARIDIEVVSKEFNWNFLNIGIVLASMGFVDKVIAEPITTIRVKNIGDDYASYVQFDVVFEVQNQVVGREGVSFNKISNGESLDRNYDQEIRTGDILSDLLLDLLSDLIESGEVNWDIAVENLEYEKF